MRAAAHEPIVFGSRLVCKTCMQEDWPCGASTHDLPWRVDLSCCGRHYVTEFFATWKIADDFRESFCSGAGVDPHGYSGTGFDGHRRAGIITDTRPTPPE